MVEKVVQKKHIQLTLQWAIVCSPLEKGGQIIHGKNSTTSMKKERSKSAEE